MSRTEMEVILVGMYFSEYVSSLVVRCISVRFSGSNGLKPRFGRRYIFRQATSTIRDWDG